MAFQCPECGTMGSLTIKQKIELPPDSAWDEIALQVVGCSRCRFQGLAVYQESRRGALDSEIWHHVGYRADEDLLAAVRKAIQGCPNASNRRCKCAAHRALGRTSEAGRWEGVAGLEWEASFPMRLGRRGRR